jgi:hypothetical protein
MTSSQKVYKPMGPPSIKGRPFSGSKEDEEEDVYFFWPVAPLRVSETAWPALLRPCVALSRMPPPSFWALSPPERVESPSFWVVDFWPSARRLAL